MQSSKKQSFENFQIRKINLNNLHITLSWNFQKIFNGLPYNKPKENKETSILIRSENKLEGIDLHSPKFTYFIFK